MYLVLSIYTVPDNVKSTYTGYLLRVAFEEVSASCLLVNYYRFYLLSEIASFDNKWCNIYLNVQPCTLLHS